MPVQPFRFADVVIEEVDIPSLSDADIEAVNAYGNVLRAESHPEDPPRPVELTRAHVRNIPSFVGVWGFWARDPAGAIAAAANVSITRTDDNKRLVESEIGVRPDCRRRGIARELLRLVAGVAEAEGRTLLIGSTSARVPAGELFMKRLGADPGLAQHTNRLPLGEVDRAMVGTWIDKGPDRAPGYTLVAVDGAYPDDLIAQVAVVHEVMNTAPRGDLDIEDFHITVEQVREREKSMLAARLERWSLFARAPSGELAGFTEVSWTPAMPKVVHQMNTGVRPEHRGHGLGKWLKAWMLRRVLAERPEAEEIRTGNADSNDAMLGINRLLGFRPYEAHMAWQISLERARAYLDARA
ncbi:MAG: GNAT family N-acetyltransferase [Acidobacteria bacterium]|nr:GNAT family N-acetyltransferase [Acidobacteriota bacterium]